MIKNPNKTGRILEIEFSFFIVLNKWIKNDYWLYFKTKLQMREKHEFIILFFSENTVVIDFRFDKKQNNKHNFQFVKQSK